jgi:hypothetical protein
MRRVFVVLLSVFAVLGMLAPPVFAQAPAAPLAPKVTINGLVDFVTDAYRNWPGLDVTDNGNDRGWYSRERGVFTLTGEIGKVKGVFAIEIDVQNGATNNTGENAASAGTGGGARTFPGTSSSGDFDGDIAGIVETKWLYVEAPLTGAGSMLPFIPVESLIRAGLQPARGVDYKVGILWSGDFPGVTIETKWAPNIRSTFVYAQGREAEDKVLAPGDFESTAYILAVEVDVFKGFTVKPVFAYADFTGGSGQGSLGNPNTSGNAYNANNTRMQRYTLGGDIRWVTGPLSIQPTVYYQWGRQECQGAVTAPGALGPCTRQWVNVSTGIADVIVGYRLGPLNTQIRGMYTPGNTADEQVADGETINYYRAVNPGFGYFAGYSEIQTSGVDYTQSLFGGAPGVSLRTSPSYDKYGRIVAALAADYSLTPALTLLGTLNNSWTAEKVDTQSFLNANGLNPSTVAGQRGSGGNARYLGTEIDLGLTYRFAPNVALDLVGAYLFAGNAMDHARTNGGQTMDADNVYKAVARVRVTW